jgi:DnaA family protein
LSQLALPLRLQDHAVFESFLPVGNESLVAFLRETAGRGDGPGGWIWGASATGKTHLLQAVCERAGDRAQFLPLKDLAAAGPEILDGLASRHFVCLDDVDRLSGNDDWEVGLFRLVNALTDAGHVMICSASAASREAGFRLPDLVSRFARLPSFHLTPLADAERMAALQLRARHRGIDLPDDTASYLLTRSQRDMASLYTLLDKLDSESLREQRRLTIPFVKKVLRFSPPGKA